MCESKFPRPLAVSAKSLWLESEILEFLRYAPSRRLKNDRTPRATACRQPTRSALPPERKPAPAAPKRAPKPPARRRADRAADDRPRKSEFSELPSKPGAAP
jgi:hypothetical protein